MGDGEPSFDAFEANNSNQEDDEYRSESRAVRKSKKSPRGASKSPEKRASRSPTKSRKKKPSRLDPNGNNIFHHHSKQDDEKEMTTLIHLKFDKT